MDLSSLNVDVLLYLMKFVKPVDRFNLVLSGILKGFERVKKGIDLHKRIEHCEAQLGLRRGGMCELEIRSLVISSRDKSILKILERLAEEGYLQNTQQFNEYQFGLPYMSPFFEVLCSMKNLKYLYLSYHLTLEALAHMFHSCSKLTELRISTSGIEMGEMGEELFNQLRTGFQRLTYLDLEYFINNDSWPGFQEMLTWLKECVQLSIENTNTTTVTDGYVFKILDPNLAKSLQIVDLECVPFALVQWILSVCLNIHTLKLDSINPPNGFHGEICCLKNMKNLDVTAGDYSDLREIFRNCRQVEVLRMNITFFTLEDLAEWEPAENMIDVTLPWVFLLLSIEDVLQMFKRWRQLHRLTFQNHKDISLPPSEVVSDFIMAMKHLSHLHIVPDYDGSNYGQLEILRDEVNELILPLRPNFKFDVSIEFV